MSRKSIVDGIEKERFAIIPDVPTKGLAKIVGLAPGLVEQGDGPLGQEGDR